MAPIHAQGASPQRAGNLPSPATGSQPRLDAETRARSKQLAAQFAAQVELTMLQSLATLGTDGEPDQQDPAQGADAGADPFGLGASDAAGASDPFGDGELGGNEFDGGEQDDMGLGTDLLQAQLVASLYTGMARRGMSAPQIEAQLAALGLASGGLAGAGANTEAALAQQLLATLGAGAARTDLRTNVQTVAGVAREHGVDPVVAVAMMLVESGGDNTAVGDGGTSFGLYQLHDGGMLSAAGLSPTQAFDPRTNAAVALRAYAHEHAKGSASRSPGEIAAASQRPADPVGYARKVDAAMDRARALLR